MPRFTLPLDKALFIQGHNMVLNQLLQIGVIGAALLIAMFASLLLVFANMLRGSVCRQTVGLCGVLLVVGVFARNMVDDFFIRQNAILFWAIVGMLLGLSEGGESSEGNEHRGEHSGERGRERNECGERGQSEKSRQ